MTYGELKAMMVAYSHRDDLTAVFPLFLIAAEQRIYYGEANTDPLRLSSMLQTVAMPDGTRPVGWIQAKRISSTQWGSKPVPLNYRPMDQIEREAGCYSWNGLVLVLGANTQFPVSMEYYGKFTTPVNDGDTNWLLTEAPMVYFNAMMVEFSKWSRNNAQLVQFAGDYNSTAQSLMEADKTAQFSGALATQRVR